MATSAAGIRKTRLQDQTFTANTRVSVPVRGLLPPGRRLRGYELVLDATITQPGAASAAILGSVLYQLIQKVQIGRRVSIGGLGLHFLNWAMDGYETDFPAGAPATNGAVFSRKISWFVPFSDYSSTAQHDGAIPTELAESDEIGVVFGNPSTIFAATAPTVTGTLYCYAVHDSAGNKKIIPASHQIMDQDFSSLSAVINKAGRWPYLIMFREASNDSGNLTSAQVSALTVRVDGEPVVMNARLQDRVTQFNREKARSPNYRTESQTAPVSGESIQAQPGVAAAAGLTVTMDFGTLLFPAKEYLIADVPEGSSLQVDLTGSVTTYKLAYLLREPRAVASASNAARKLGAQPGAGLYVRSASGLAVPDSDIHPYLPQQVG